MCICTSIPEMVPAGPARTVVDIVCRPESSSEFPGLYSFLALRLAFAFVNNERLLFTSHWGSTMRVWHPISPQIMFSISSSPVTRNCKVCNIALIASIGISIHKEEKGGFTIRTLFFCMSAGNGT